MNKTLNINLGGQIFHIDEDAYHILEKYLHTLKLQFSGASGGEEIIKDVEMRLAELFRERTTDAKQVITRSDVNEVIGIMGKPEDYIDSGDEEFYENLGQFPGRHPKRMFRDTDDRILGGVASGLAAYFNIEAVWMRLLFFILVISGGFGVVLYIILWLVMPKAVTTAEKLQMRGETVNLSNIERSIREEMGEVNDQFSKGTRSQHFRKAGNNLGNFISDFLNFVVDALKLIFRFLFKVIGLFFLAIGFFVLFGIVIAAFTGGTYLAGSGYGYSEMYEFLGLLAVNSTHLNLFLVGISLLILAPLTLLIYLGIRIIFKIGRLNRAATGGLITFSVIGILLIVASGIRLGMDFDRHGEFVSTEELRVNAQTLHLRADEDSLNKDFRGDHFGDDWVIINGEHYFANVFLDIQPSQDERVYLEQRNISEGPSRRAARAYAENISYRYSSTDSIFHFPMYYRLDSDSKFRNQEVWLSLYLPVGKKVYLDHSLMDMLYDVDNIHHTYDYDMLGHTWEMTEEGLLCLDCPKDYYPENEQDSTEDEIHIEINDKGVVLKTLSALLNDKESMQPAFSHVAELVRI